jgi:hypothetical protein
LDRVVQIPAIHYPIAEALNPALHLRRQWP